MVSLEHALISSTAAQKMNVIFSILYVSLEAAAYLEDAVSAYYENIYTPLPHLQNLAAQYLKQTFKSKESKCRRRHIFFLSTKEQLWQRPYLVPGVLPRSPDLLWYCSTALFKGRQRTRIALFGVLIFSKGYGPSRAREYFYHTPVLTTVNIGSWHV